MDMDGRMDHGEIFTKEEILAEMNRLKKVQSKMVGDLYPRIIEARINRLREALIAA